MVWVKGQSGNPAGGPVGNQHAKKHGVRALQMARRIGQIDKRTAFGQAFEKRKREYIAHLGGDVSAMELAIIEDTVWTDFYTTNYDVYLAGLKTTVRKGRPHPIVDARTRLARISHNGIVSRAASAEKAFTSMIRGDQHYCHGDRQAIGRRWQRFGFVRAYARFAGIAIPSLPIRQITRR